MTFRLTGRARDASPSRSPDTITVPPTGASVAAGAFPGFATFASTLYTNSTGRFLRATNAMTTDAPYTAKSNFEALDQEITTYTERGHVILRYKDGAGIYMTWVIAANSPNGTLRIGFVRDINETIPVLNDNSNGLTAAVFSTDNLIGDFGVVRANQGTDTFTFGVRGFDIYVRYNGAELNIPALKGAAWRRMEAGACLLAAYAASGFRDVALSYPTRPSNRYSNFAAKVIDLRDYGIKSTATTGSIASGSNQLMVASATGFAVGDQIIVAVGGETALSSIYGNTAAAGRRGTMGVGGSWPSGGNIFATEAQLLASTPADGTSSGALDTGKVWFRTGGSWAYESTYYYWNMICPRALVARITGIAGNVLTLDQNASAAASNAEVTFDCLPCFKAITDDVPVAPSDVTILVPPGDFRLSGGISMPLVATRRVGWHFRGAGRDKTTFIHPKGASWVFLGWGSHRGRISDFKLISNHGAHGYGTSGRAEGGGGINIQGINVVFLEGCVVERVDGAEIPQQFLRCQFASGARFRDVLIERKVWPDECYIQWQAQIVNSSDCSFEDVFVDSDWLLKSFNTFASERTIFRRCNGRNATYASNSSSGFLWEDCEVDFEPLCRPTGVAAPILDQSIMDINTNISNTSGGTNTARGTGGIVRRPRINIQGYMDSTNTVLRAINISNARDILIEGNYRPSVKNDGLRRGFIRAPWSPTSAPQGLGQYGPHIGSDGANVTVRNMRVQGFTAPPSGGATMGTGPTPFWPSVNAYFGRTGTSSDVNALGVGLGALTVNDLTHRPAVGHLRFGTEIMAYQVIDPVARTLQITARGVNGTTPATHTNGATCTFLDEPRVVDCIADAIGTVSVLGVQSGNVTNAAYDALP